MYSKAAEDDQLDKAVFILEALLPKTHSKLTIVCNYLEQIKFFKFRHNIRVLHVTENEPDDAAKPHHEVEGGQNNANGVHSGFQLTAAAPQHQPHHLDVLMTGCGAKDVKWI